MGAWGTGNFENDDALDWIYELERAEDSSLLAETLRVVAGHGDEYLEDPDCCRALAAAEVVCALYDAPSPNLPQEVKGWISVRRPAPEPSMIPSALAAVARIRTQSELKDLIDESEHAAERYAVLSDLEGRLKRINA